MVLIDLDSIEFDIQYKTHPFVYCFTYEGLKVPGSSLRLYIRRWLTQTAQKQLHSSNRLFSGDRLQFSDLVSGLKIRVINRSCTFFPTLESAFCQAFFKEIQDETFDDWLESILAIHRSRRRAEVLKNLQPEEIPYSLFFQFQGTSLILLDSEKLVDYFLEDNGFVRSNRRVLYIELIRIITMHRSIIVKSSGMEMTFLWCLFLKTYLPELILQKRVQFSYQPDVFKDVHTMIEYEKFWVDLNEKLLRYYPLRRSLSLKE